MALGNNYIKVGRGTYPATRFYKKIFIIKFILFNIGGMGIPPYSLEVGQNLPSITTLEKIADVLDVELYELFRYTNYKSKNFKEEINMIYDKLNKDKQFTLYQVAKAME